MIEGISISPDVCHGKPVIRGTRVLLSQKGQSQKGHIATNNN